MALAQTELPELKRFTFFVSRRFEEGRERFRLHMGFFASQAEAEEWLGVVRDIYPGAWAGEAPGKKLRARAAEAAAAQARHAVGPQRGAVPAAPAPAPAPRPIAQRQSAPPAAPVDILKRVPTLHPPAAAPRPALTPSASRQAPVVSRQAPVALRQPPVAPRQPPSAKTAPQSQQMRAPQPRPAGVPPGGQRPATKAAAPARPAAARPAPAAMAARPLAQAPLPTQQPGRKPALSRSNVKEVLAALDTPNERTGETRLMPSPAVPDVEAADDSSLTDTQVLRFLESRRDEGRTDPFDPAAASGISLLKPEDTGTRRALKVAVSRDEQVSFAVQLQWSVTPVALDKVPPLAIFSAYTLYSVEGSREGRKWYGLRLGFFTDAISAKQVAYYVRSEFASVAVVPVSAQERERATSDNQRFAAAGAAKKRHDSDEFKLIDSDTPAAPAAPAPRVAPAGTTAAAAAPQPTTTKSARKGGAGTTVGARERRTPQTLEETLEILGANELAIDSGSRDVVSESGVRHLRVEIQKNTPFSRLLERLSERVRKS